LQERKQRRLAFLPGRTAEEDEETTGFPLQRSRQVFTTGRGVFDSESDGGVALDDSDIDSLFGEPRERPKNNEGITWRPSEVDLNVQIAEPRSSSVNEKDEQPASKPVVKVLQTSPKPGDDQAEKPAPKAQRQATKEATSSSNRA
jgi:hypothetical protein